MSDWNPHITVATVVEKNDRFLLVHELDHGNSVYNQPAGHWEMGETLIEAAKRETLEETGWEVEIESLLGIYVYTSPRNGVTYQRIAFSGRPLSEKNTALDEGIMEALWLDLKAIKACQQQHRSPMVMALIKDFIDGKRFPLSMIHHVS